MDRGLLEEHLEEAGFLWRLWSGSLESPEFVPEVVAGGEEARWLAHLDALGAAPLRWLADRLLDDEPEAVCPAALALLLGPHGARGCSAVLGALCEEPELEEPAALAAALELAAPLVPGLVEQAMGLLGHPEPEVRAVAAGTLTAAGVALPREHGALLSDDHPGVRAAALGCPLELWALGAVHGALSADDPGVRDAALRAGLRAGSARSWRRCLEVVREGAEEPRRPMLLAALFGGDEGVATLSGQLGSRGERGRAALFALGHTGRRAAVDAAVERVDGPEEQARLAGEVVWAVTGLALGEAGMARPEDKPEEEPVALEDDDLDAELVATPEASLPLPLPGEVSRWWSANRGRFDPGTRYLFGAPCTPGELGRAWRQAPMRRRHALALECDVRSRGALPLGSRQWVRLQLCRSPGPEGLSPQLLERPGEVLFRW